MIVGSFVVSPSISLSSSAGFSLSDVSLTGPSIVVPIAIAVLVTPPLSISNCVNTYDEVAVPDIPGSIGSGVTRSPVTPIVVSSITVPETTKFPVLLTVNV